MKMKLLYYNSCSEVLVTTVFLIILITHVNYVFPIKYPTSPAIDYTQNDCPFVTGLHANLLRFIKREGFHRDLEDTVEITVTNSPIPLKHFTTGECIFAIYATLSRDVFVDPYEILNSKDLRDYVRVLNNWTDLENPSWLAKSNSTVFIQLQTVLTGNLISTDPINLPIHYRYQKPLSHSRIKKGPGQRPSAGSGSLNPGGYIPVTLPLPEIILRCENWDPITLEEQCQTVKTICDRKSSKSSECVWVKVPYKANSKSGTVFIPIGDSDNLMLVTGVTMGVVLGGMGFLLVTIFKAKLRNEEIFAHPKID